MKQEAQRTMEINNNAIQAKNSLDKKGLIIFIISLVLSISLIVTGTVSLIPENSNELKKGKHYSYNLEAGQYYVFDFTPNESETINIYLSGAKLSIVQNLYGNTFKTTNKSSNSYKYDVCYEVQMTKNVEYKISIVTVSSNVKIYIN